MTDEEQSELEYYQRKSRLFQDALIYFLEHVISPKPELLIHNDHKAITIKMSRDKKYIFFGDGKALVSEKSPKGLTDTMKEEKI